MSRIRKIAVLLVGALAVLAALPAVAFGAHGTLEAMRVMSQQMGDGSLVRIMATIDSQTELPATIELLIPNEFTYSSAELLQSEKFAEGQVTQPVGEAKVKTTVGKTDTSYVVTLENADTALLEFVAPAGIYSLPANGHATIQLGLLAATDIKFLEYGFVLPTGAEAVGKDVVIFGETEEGNHIAGQIFEDVKAGTRETARIAIGANTKAAAEIISAEESASAAAAWFTDKNNLIVMALIAAVILLAAVAAAIGLGRRRAAEELEYGEEYEYEDEFEGEYEGEYDLAADEVSAADSDVAEAEVEVGTAPQPRGDFFRD